LERDIEAAWRHQLAPSGLTREDLRVEPRGVSLPLRTAHRKHEDLVGASVRGFRTPTGLVELYAQTRAEQVYPALPTFSEPPLSPHSRPDLAAQFPLNLTCAKALHFCESQHRQVAELRRASTDPQVEIHPQTAGARGITKGSWVRIATPNGSIRAGPHSTPGRLPPSCALNTGGGRDVTSCAYRHPTHTSPTA
jgi:anaerobic selenocysteine-containing dehydrogenase